MKKYRKNFNTKRMTVEAMATCYQKCCTNCLYCTAACDSAANGAALIGIEAYGGTPQPSLAAVGSSV